MTNDVEEPLTPAGHAAPEENEMSNYTELLAVCRAIRDTLEAPYDADNDAGSATKHLEALRTAIDKAEREQARQSGGGET